MIKLLKKLCSNPHIITYRLRKYLYTIGFISDKCYLKLLFKRYMGYSLDLQNPNSFNEKLQWLKLYDRNPLYTILTDKIKVKKWVAEKIGEEYIIPTLDIWEKPEDIDFNKLPDKFVLKCNHNSGKGLFICIDKNKIELKSIIRELKRGLKEDYSLTSGEWPYKNIKRKILAEKYISSSNGEDLKDYKFFCFNGNPKVIQVDYDRFTNHKRNLYNIEWQRLPFKLEYPTDWKYEIEKPENLMEMVEIAKKLSSGIPHVRVDLYNVNGKVYFGEMTFFHGSGYEKFEPIDWDYKLGDFLELPKINVFNN